MYVVWRFSPRGFANEVEIRISSAEVVAGEMESLMDDPNTGSFVEVSRHRSLGAAEKAVAKEWRRLEKHYEVDGLYGR